MIVTKGGVYAFLFNLNYFFAPFPYITFRIIMSFRKPCHMPLRKLILLFTLTVLNSIIIVEVCEK